MVPIFVYGEMRENRRVCRNFQSGGHLMLGKISVKFFNCEAMAAAFLRVSFLWMVFAFIPHAAPCANRINISGTVLDGSESPVADAEVHLHNLDHLRTRSDAQGHFVITEETAVGGSRLSRAIRDNRTSATIVSIYDCMGRRVLDLPAVPDAFKTALRKYSIASGVYLIVSGKNGKRVNVAVAAQHGFFALSSVSSVAIKRDPQRGAAVREGEFRDILVVSAEGTQTARRAVGSPEEGDITIHLMPLGASNVTPGVPLFTENGGLGDVTTYGSVSDPEYSDGGACNYGSTAIRYYAAINVNQLSGDLRGQWQEGRICGRCARVSVAFSDGTIRTTVVRVVDRCPDDNCGIDLGGAPAQQIMGSAPGRYYGEWEWVSCDGVEGVSDGSPALHVKEGSNSWWSLVQMRNGPGSVSGMGARRVGTLDWTPFAWATEAENFFSVPLEILQDSEHDWEIEIEWTDGGTDTLRIKGSDLAVENGSYPL